MRQRVLWLSIGILGAVLLACGSSASGLAVDTEAPDFGVNNKGQVVAVSDYRGQVVLVGFWSST